MVRQLRYRTIPPKIGHTTLPQAMAKPNIRHHASRVAVLRRAVWVGRSQNLQVSSYFGGSTDPGGARKGAVRCVLTYDEAKCALVTPARRMRRASTRATDRSPPTHRYRFRSTSAPSRYTPADYRPARRPAALAHQIGANAQRRIPRRRGASPLRPIVPRTTGRDKSPDWPRPHWSRTALPILCIT